MSRKSKLNKREILPDPKFNSKLVAKFINHIISLSLIKMVSLHKVLEDIEVGGYYSPITTLL